MINGAIYVKQAHGAEVQMDIIPLTDLRLKRPALAPMINIDLDAYFKDRYWSGWWWDRSCLYDHEYDRDCEDCQHGTWYYTSPDKTGMKKFGEIIGDDVRVYAEGRVYMDPGDMNKRRPKQRK